MNAAFSQHLTEQCWGLLAGECAPDVCDQLKMWIVELRADAEVSANAVNSTDNVASVETGSELSPG